MNPPGRVSGNEAGRDEAGPNRGAAPVVKPGSVPQPYKGLVPYAEADAALFFGRDRERELIEANLMSARLTVLYGPSGVGKTSVLQAGVIHGLRRQALQNFHTYGAPEFAVVTVSHWAGDPITAIEVAVHQGVLAALGADTLGGVPAAGGDLVDTLRTWGERLNGELLVVLDQFEEYFLYHAGAAADERFIAQFSHAVSDAGVPARFLVSLREDALAQLDRFKGRIDGLFDNTLRIDRLDRNAAQRAIDGPIAWLNAGAVGTGTQPAAASGGKVRAVQASPHWTLEAGLVNDVLDQVQTGRVAFGGDGASGRRDVLPIGTSQARVDTPYLQLVMQRLWHEEAAAGSYTLRRATLGRLGGADRIVRTHLDGVMATLSAALRETAFAVFHHLVTPSGMKIAHSVVDLAEYAGEPAADVQRLVDALSSGQARVLRPVASADEHEARRYEIYHDVLAAAILDWRQRFVQGKADAVAADAQRSQRRAQKLLACAAALPALMLVQLLLALQLGGEADEVFANLSAVRVQAVQPEPVTEVRAASTPLSGLLKAEIESGSISLTRYEGSTRISLPSDGLFESGDARITASSQAIFDRLGTALARTSGAILVTGHTDNVPTRTLRYPSNWHLSYERALAAQSLLSNTVAGNRLRAEGRADTEPLANNDTAEGRARNRRIEIIVYDGGQR